MSPARFACCLFAAGALLAPSFTHAQDHSARVIDRLFEDFWTSASPAEAANPAGALIEAGVTFDQAWQRLKAGRTYSAQPSGVVQLSRRTADDV